MKKYGALALVLLLLFLLAGCNDPLYGSLPPYEQGYPIFTTLEGEVPVIGSIPSHAVAGQTVRILLDEVTHQSYTATLNGERLAVQLSEEDYLYYEFVMPEGSAELKIVTYYYDVPCFDDYDSSSLKDDEPLPPTTLPLVIVDYKKTTPRGFEGVVADPYLSTLQKDERVEVVCDLERYGKILQQGRVIVEFDYAKLTDTQSGYRLLASEAINSANFSINLTLEGEERLIKEALLYEIPSSAKAGEKIPLAFDLRSLLREYSLFVELDGEQLDVLPGSDEGLASYDFKMPPWNVSLKISLFPYDSIADGRS